MITRKLLSRSQPSLIRRCGGYVGGDVGLGCGSDLTRWISKTRSAYLLRGDGVGKRTMTMAASSATGNISVGEATTRPKTTTGRDDFATKKTSKWAVRVAERRDNGGDRGYSTASAAAAATTKMTRTQRPRPGVAGEGTSRAVHRRVNGSAAAFASDRLLVIGSGVAGSAAALIAAEIYKIPVTMIYAGQVPTDCNSYWAQGGIIYRNYDPESGDSAALLAQDIHRAGAGLCLHDAVMKVSTEGPHRVRQLLLDQAEAALAGRNGEGGGDGPGPFAQVPFDRDDETGELSLCLEASHTAPRILHNADHTGRTITEHISSAVARHPLIRQLPRTVVTDLIVDEVSNHCVGVETLDRTTGIQNALLSTYGTVVASGGLAGIYEHTTNPVGFNALGSSVALAVRAGVEVRDLEYVQFHPTALCIPDAARFLLTEALRGEGAVLRDATGRAFARDYHPDGELAPRDIVARAVFEEAQKGRKVNGDHEQHNVFLDITHRDAHWLHGRFPSIQEHLEQYGYDLAKDPLPITPAAHYTCGGISTDLHGCTSLPGLYAAGEAARTGLHGGNRLASTSLLEGLVFGASVADCIGSGVGRDMRDHAVGLLQNRRQQQDRYNSYPSSSAAAGWNGDDEFGPKVYWNGNYIEPFHIENTAYRSMQLLSRLRRTMWDNVGVVRSPDGLEIAMDEIGDVRDEILHLHGSCPTLETAAVRDAAYAGMAVAEAAISNRTSVGAHCIVLPDANSGEESDEEDQQVAAAR